MYIIEIYVKNKSRQLFGDIIIPMTSVVHPVPTSSVVTHQMPPRITHCSAMTAALWAFKYRTVVSTDGFFSPHPRPERRLCSVASSIVGVAQRGAVTFYFIQGGTDFMFLRKMFLLS